MTSPASWSQSAPVGITVLRPPTLANLAALLALLPFVAGLLFHTYAIALPLPGLESNRQLGTLFLAAECWVIVRALRAGFDPAAFLHRLPQRGRYLFYAWLAVFPISSVVFAPFHPPGISSLLYNASLPIHLLFAAALSETLTRYDNEDLRRLALLMGGASAAFAAFIAIKFLGRPWLDDGSSDPKVWQFAIPGFISVRLFGAYVGALLIFVVTVLLLQAKKGPVGLGLYASATVLAALTLWSGTRAAVLAIVLVGPAIAIAFQLVPDRGVVARLALGLMIAIGVAALCLPPEDVAFRLINWNDFESADALTGGRMALWHAIWTAYLEHPVFGAGPFATMWVLPSAIPPHVQPHNVILQFLISWGAVGAAVAFVLLGWVTWKAHKIAWRIRTLAPLLAMLDTLLIMSLFDGTLHFARFLMLVMICYGAIFAMNRHHPSGKIAIPGR